MIKVDLGPSLPARSGALVLITHLCIYHRLRHKRFDNDPQTPRESGTLNSLISGRCDMSNMEKLRGIQGEAKSILVRGSY